MFDRLGRVVVAHWRAVLVVWTVVIAVTFVLTPAFETQVTDGEFAFLPSDSPSLVAEQLFRDAFPAQLAASDQNDPDRSVRQNPLGSNIVIVVHRADPLRDDDFVFVDDVLVPALKRTADDVRAEDDEHRLGAIQTYKDDIGPLLRSPNNHATLVVLELTTEFLDRSNGDLIARIEDLIASDPEIDRKLPTGLELTLSGAATVGRDMLRAEYQSGQRVEMVTPLVVIGLLVIIYRAPLVAIIPLATVAAGVLLTLRLLAGMAQMNMIGMFSGLEVYVRVVMYGAGVDYCLFLIARYREGLSEGMDYQTSLASAVGRVGPALATSAGTSIVGIGMMMTSEFGKFAQAGFGIAFGLAIVLCAALTFTPAMLAMLERTAFWPQNRVETAAESMGPIASTPWLARLRVFLGELWSRVAARIEARPLTWLLAGVLALVPFSLVAPKAARQLSYGLLTDLPQDEPSVSGAVAIQEHFPAGMTGPVTILVSSPELQDESPERVSRTATRALHDAAESLNLADVRSQAQPLGKSGNPKSIVARKAMLVKARPVFLSDTPEYPGTVMRFDLIFESDPFARDSMQQVTRAEEVVAAALPDSIRDTATVSLIGATAGLRDLKTVTDRDQLRIQVGVSLAVYVIIVILLRRPAVCLFLIASVVFSYLATLGLTYLTFYAIDPTNFTGLDWKVPIFLFTLLIALGEDYNILLMARVVEERKHHGPLRCVSVAMSRTGGIISSCGLIMAGTFAALMSGTLLGMVQLGFALTAGVLIDTFLVRPVIVPAWLMLLNSGRLGVVGRLLGADVETAEQQAARETLSAGTTGSS